MDTTASLSQFAWIVVPFQYFPQSAHDSVIGIYSLIAICSAWSVAGH